LNTIKKQAVRIILNNLIRYRYFKLLLVVSSSRQKFAVKVNR